MKESKGRAGGDRDASCLSLVLSTGSTKLKSSRERGMGRSASSQYGGAVWRGEGRL